MLEIPVPKQLVSSAELDTVDEFTLPEGDDFDHTLGLAEVQVYSSSTAHELLQPSPLDRLPSSQASPESKIPLPHFRVQIFGDADVQL